MKVVQATTLRLIFLFGVKGMFASLKLCINLEKEKLLSKKYWQCKNNLKHQVFWKKLFDVECIVKIIVYL